MISPKITIPIVDPITATNPDDKASMKMVRVELTSTLPRSKLSKNQSNIQAMVSYHYQDFFFNCIKIPIIDRHTCIEENFRVHELEQSP